MFNLRQYFSWLFSLVFYQLSDQIFCESFLFLKLCYAPSLNMIRLIADKMRYLLSIQKHQSEGKYKSYNKPGLRKNLSLKSKSSLRYVEIVSRFGNRKSYFQFRFVACFKWTSSLAGDKVKRLLN